MWHRYRSTRIGVHWPKVELANGSCPTGPESQHGSQSHRQQHPIDKGIDIVACAASTIASLQPGVFAIESISREIFADRCEDSDLFAVALPIGLWTTHLF